MRPRLIVSSTNFGKVRAYAALANRACWSASELMGTGDGGLR